MIVKNESRVIRRCLESVKPLLDYWVIVDTGSDDNTLEIIRDTLQEIPGELHQRPWQNFAHNRTEALALAKGKGDFALLIDADEEVVIQQDFIPPDLRDQGHIIEVHYDSTVFHREIFINNHLDWYWKGVLHEQIYCKQKLERIMIAKGIYNVSRPEGNRSLNPKKYQADAELLEKELEADPGNSRYVFYLAQSYACSGNAAKARPVYRRRVGMGGWSQEIYYSMYAAAYMGSLLGEDPYALIDEYAKAYQFRPSRVEPLFRIGSLYFNMGLYALGKIVAQYGSEIPLSKDSMFVEPNIYRFGMKILYADCCRELDERQEAIREYENVLKIKELSPDLQERLRANISALKAMPPKMIRPESIPYL